MMKNPRNLRKKSERKNRAVESESVGLTLYGGVEVEVGIDFACKFMVAIVG